MDEINELIKNDLKDRSWRNHYDKLDLSRQPHLPRIYFFGSVFGVILFLDGDGKDRKDTSFSIIMNHSADVPNLVEKDCTASTWIDDLIKQFERAKKRTKPLFINQKKYGRNEIKQGNYCIS